MEKKACERHKKRWIPVVMADVGGFGYAAEGGKSRRAGDSANVEKPTARRT